MASYTKRRKFELRDVLILSWKIDIIRQCRLQRWYNATLLATKSLMSALARIRTFCDFNPTAPAFRLYMCNLQPGKLYLDFSPTQMLASHFSSVQIRSTCVVLYPPWHRAHRALHERSTRRMGRRMVSCSRCMSLQPLGEATADANIVIDYCSYVVWKQEAFN